MENRKKREIKEKNGHNTFIHFKRKKTCIDPTKEKNVLKNKKKKFVLGHKNQKRTECVYTCSTENIKKGYICLNHCCNHHGGVYVQSHRHMPIIHISCDAQCVLLILFFTNLAHNAETNVCSREVSHEEVQSFFEVHKRKKKRTNIDVQLYIY